MHVDTPGAAATLPTARLLIHAEVRGCAGGGRLETTLWRLRALYSSRSGQDERTPLCLQIDDLQGNRVLDINDAGALVDVILPARTYLVTAQRGIVRRSYTLTLAPDEPFNLYLRLAPKHH